MAQAVPSITVRPFLLVLLLVVGARPALAQHSSSFDDASPYVRTFTVRELEQAGVIRLTDLFRLLDRWDTTFIDDFTWHASPAALAPAQDPGWLLLLDDQPFDVDVLGLRNLNTLPVHLAQIDSVTVIGRPAAAAGRFAPAGIIRIHTSAETPTFRFAAAAGNEIGDPGPYRFTRFRSVNVDRIGPSLFAETGHTSTLGSVGLSVKRDVHHATDARIRERLFRFYDPSGGPPRRILMAPRLSLRYGAGRAQHTLQISHTSLQDFYRPLPLGSEVPTRYRHTFIGQQGRLPRSHLPLRYRVSYASIGLHHRPNRSGLGFDWQENRLQGAMTFAPASSAHPEVGVSFDLYRSRPAAPLDDPLAAVGRVFGSTSFAPSPNWHQQVHGFVTRAETAWGVQLTSSTQVDLTKAQSLLLTLSGGRRPLSEHPGPWYWIEQGYDFLSERGASITFRGAPHASTSATTNVGWHARLAASLEVTLGAMLHHAFSTPAVQQTIGYNADDSALVPATSVVYDASGQRLQGSGTVHWTPLLSLEQRWTYVHQHTVNGGSAFDEVWASSPQHHVSYTAHYRPDTRFSAYGRLAYRSTSRWPSFRPASQTAGDLYPDHLPAYWLADLTFQKQLLGDHMQARLSLRNILNEPLRLHPAGAVSHLMFFVSLRATF